MTDQGHPTPPAVPAQGAGAESAADLMVIDDRTGPAGGGELIGGRFERSQRLGGGRLGDVQLVRDRQLDGRYVALKLIHEEWSQSPTFRELFFQEMRAAQDYASHFVVPVRDCGQLPSGQLFFTMDFVEGETVADLLRRESHLAPRHAFQIAHQILMALTEVHDRGLVHREIEPTNVLLASRTPKTDDNPFGVRAMLLDVGLSALNETLEAGRGPNAPQYASPERAAGEPIDHSSDLFAVGILLFEMLVGDKPFRTSTGPSARSSVGQVDPNAIINEIRGLDGATKKILRRSLATDYEARFVDATEFIQALENAPAWKANGNGPRWAVPALLVMGASVVGLASWQLVGLRTGDDTTAVIDAGAESARAELEAATVRITELETEVADVAAAKDEVATEAAGELERLTAKVAELEETLGRERADHAKEMASRADDDAEREALKRELREARAEARLARAEAEAARTAGPRDAGQPSGVDSSHVVVNPVDEADLESALERYDLFIGALGGTSAVQPPSGAALSLTGEDSKWIEQLAATAHGLAGIRVTNETLQECFARYEAARADLEQHADPDRVTAFLANEYEWMDEERQAALGSAFHALNRRSTEIAGDLAKQVDARVDALEGEENLDAHALGLLTFLTEVGAHAPEGRERAVDHFVERCQTVSVSGDWISAEGLRALPVRLDEVARTAVSHSGSNGEYDDMLWLATARAWYLAPDQPLPAWTSDFVDRELTQPIDKERRDWRTLLAFQYQLTHSVRALPNDPEARLVFRTEDSRGQRAWWTYAVERNSRGKNELVRQTVDSRGKSRARTPFPFDTTASGSFRFETRTLFDRRSPVIGEARFEEWPAPTTADREAFVGSDAGAFSTMGRVVTPEVIVREAYRGAWTPDDGHACLVVNKGGFEFWIHPILGVVRQELALVTADLVHIDR